MYPSQSYDASASSAPNAASPPAPQDLAAPRKNGTQEHSVVNFTPETSDSMAIHAGTATQSAANLSYFIQFKSVLIHTHTFSVMQLTLYLAVSSPRKVYDTRDGGHSSVTQIDFDDDKYRRRPALSWFARILKLVSGSKTPCLFVNKIVEIYFLSFPSFPLHL